MLFNRDPNGCGQGCPDLHICNYVLPDGRVCGANNIRRCIHHPRKTGANLIPVNHLIDSFLEA